MTYIRALKLHEPYLFSVPFREHTVIQFIDLFFD